MIRPSIMLLSFLSLFKNDYDFRQTKEQIHLPDLSFHLFRTKAKKGKAKVEQVEVLHTDARAP